MALPILLLALLAVPSEGRKVRGGLQQPEFIGGLPEKYQPLDRFGNRRREVEYKGQPGAYLNYSQTVDHFDPLGGGGRFQQRYYVDNTSAVPGGPVLFFIGAEERADDQVASMPQMATWARDFNATYVLLEHRFYGQSMPKEDLATANYRLLSADQALEDAAQFLSWFNSTLPLGPGGKASKWINFGCSYSGALSSWFRLRFPDLTVGAYAASGPVQAEAAFGGYVEQFSTVASPQCAARLARGIREVEAELEGAGGNKSALAAIGREFNTCPGYDLTPDQLFYFKYLVNVQMTDKDQSQYPPYWPVKSLCDVVMEAATDRSSVSDGFNFAVGERCTSFNVSFFLDYLRNEKPPNYLRSWYWQKCTEFGFFKSTGAESSFFRNVSEAGLVGWCREIFGIDLAPQTATINRRYGGNQHLYATNLVNSQGTMDPWHLLGINANISEPPYRVIETFTYSAGHCDPLLAHTSQDPEDLTRAREGITDRLWKFLAQ